MIRLASSLALAALLCSACGSVSQGDFGNTRTPDFGSQAVVTGGSVRGSGG